MRVRRRGLVAGGFEAFELPPQRGTPPVDPFRDFQINQTGRQPRRVVLESVPRVAPGPAVTEAGFDRNRVVGMLDLATSQIGRSIVLGAGGAAAVNGQSAPLLDARCSDQRARQVTCQLSVESGPTAGLDRDIVALVSWGVGGMMVSNVEIDFIDGSCFSLVCSFLRVLARSDAVAAATQFQVGAFIGYEPRGTGSAVRGPQRTQKVGLATAAGAAVPVTVPRYATSFSYMRTPLTSAITLTVTNIGGTILGVIPVAAGADVSQNVYPLPNDAASIDVAATAVDQARGRVIFGLSL